MNPYYQNSRAFNYQNTLGHTETLDYDLYRKATRVTDPRGFILAFSLLEYLVDKKKLIFPTWSTDLFTWKFHMQLAHLGGWVFIAMGLTHISVGIIQYGKVHKDGVLMFASGVGIVVGLFLVVRIFKEKFATVDPAKARENIING